MDRNFDTVQIVIVVVVALRKESVDRNVYLYNFKMFACIVALRKESVDRNCSGAKADSASECRSPQGERG